jgi:hypothetical protein
LVLAWIVDPGGPTHTTNNRRRRPAATAVDAEIAERFVRENWSALASCAWLFHLRHGPGALIVQWGIVERWSRDPAFPFQPSYATATENADFNTVIADYDPRTAIVVAFSEGPIEERRRTSDVPAPHGPVKWRPGTAVAAMTVTADPPPPQAHRARGH